MYIYMHIYAVYIHIVTLSDCCVLDHDNSLWACVVCVQSSCAYINNYTHISTSISIYIQFIHMCSIPFRLLRTRARRRARLNPYASNHRAQIVTVPGTIPPQGIMMVPLD